MVLLFLMNGVVCVQLSRIPHTLLVLSLVASLLMSAVKLSNCRFGIRQDKRDLGLLCSYFLSVILFCNVRLSVFLSILCGLVTHEQRCTIFFFWELVQLGVQQFLCRNPVSIYVQYMMFSRASDVCKFCTAISHYQVQ